MIAPPIFAGLEWTQTATGSVRAEIAQDSGFWRYYRAGRERLYRIGLTVIKVDGVLFTIFSPSASVTVDLVTETMADLQGIVDLMPPPPTPEQRAAWDAQRRARDERAQRDLERHISDGEQCKADATALLNKWGEFASDKPTLRKILATDPSHIWNDQKKAVRRAVEKTEARAAARINSAGDLVGGVDWPDDRVVAAVKILTAHDQDHASQHNSIGWSSTDSSIGHWCAAMLNGEYRALAIKTSRTLVGRYTRQLVRAGVLGPEALAA